MNNINFFCISSEQKNQTLAKLLKKACDKHEITFHSVDCDQFDFSNPDITKKGDIVYRTDMSMKARIIERLLIKKNIISFHKSCSQSPIIYIDNVIEFPILFQQNNIPTPKTIFSLASDKELLKKYVNKLNCFPIVIKTTGKYAGVGVIKIESYQNLISLANYFETLNTNFVMKEYIDVGKPIYSNRAIILGKKIVLAYQLINDQTDDFRSNSGKEEKKRKIIQLNQKNQKILVKAVRLLQLELGAVDFIFDKNNQLKIFEINFPFDFSRVVSHLKFNIHELMVQFLINKSNKITVKQ